MELYNLDKMIKNSKKELETVLEFIKNTDLKQLKAGQHSINSSVFYNVIAYEATSETNREWESHRKYLDVHIPLEGSEKILHNFLDDMEVIDYKSNEDTVVIRGDAKNQIIVTRGDILIFDENDAHKTGIEAYHKEMIRKIVFKILI